MKPHPIQHLDTTILVVNFSTNWDFNPESEDVFDFNGVEIGTFSDIRPIDDDDYHQFAIRLGIDVENLSGKACPYTFKVEVGGLFEITKKVTDPNISNIVKQQAMQTLSIVIREMIANLSARGAFGAIQLPSMIFPVDEQSKTSTRPSKPSAVKIKSTDVKKTSKKTKLVNPKT